MTREEKDNKSTLQEEELFPVFKFDLDNRLVYANMPAIPLMKAWKCRVNERIPAEVISTYPELFHSAMSHRPHEITVELQDCHIKFAIVPFPEAGFIGMYAFCLEKNGRIASQRVFDTAQQVKQESL